MRILSFKLPAFILFFLALTSSFGQQTTVMVTRVFQTNDVTILSVKPNDTIQFHQGDSIVQDTWVTRLNEAVNMTAASNTYPVWYFTSANKTQYWFITTGIVVNATDGHTRVSANYTQTTVPTGEYYSTIILYQDQGGAHTSVATIADNPVTVLWTPGITNYVAAFGLSTLDYLRNEDNHTNQQAFTNGTSLGEFEDIEWQGAWSVSNAVDTNGHHKLYVNLPTVSASGKTNIYRAVITSSTDFISFESNNTDGTIGYYVFSSTNGGGGSSIGQTSGWVRLGKVTVTTDTEAIQFTAIPTNFRALRLYVRGKSSRNTAKVDTCGVRFNGDATSGNYPLIYWYSDSSAAQLGMELAETVAYIGNLTSATGATGFQGTCELLIQGSNETNWWIQTMASSATYGTNTAGANNSYLEFMGSGWKSIGPITDIVVRCLVSNIVANSQADLEGLLP